MSEKREISKLVGSVMTPDVKAGLVYHLPPPETSEFDSEDTYDDPDSTVEFPEDGTTEEDVPVAPPPPERVREWWKPR